MRMFSFTILSLVITNLMQLYKTYKLSKFCYKIYYIFCSLVSIDILLFVLNLLLDKILDSFV